ncbi:MAG TPA: kelch repeat-containing protein, partial [Ilumatobacter sp.]|nr:kelch repeat-containing protein [Ilumatobacter sp.]
MPPGMEEIMAGTWATLTNAPPAAVATTLLLTDGTVLAQGVSTNQWYRFSPNANGDYLSGTWQTVAASANAPLYYASGVLRDGRVIVVGGEYNNGVIIWLLAAEIYDPQADTWTQL